MSKIHSPFFTLNHVPKNLRTFYKPFSRHLWLISYAEKIKLPEMRLSFNKEEMKK